MDNWLNELENRKQKKLAEEKAQARKTIQAVKKEQRARLATQAAVLQNVKQTNLEKLIDDLMQHAVFGNPKYGNPGLTRKLFFEIDKHEIELWPPAQNRPTIEPILEEQNMKGSYLKSITWEITLFRKSLGLHGIRVEISKHELRINGQLMKRADSKLIQKDLLLALDNPIQLN